MWCLMVCCIFWFLTYILGFQWHLIIFQDIFVIVQWCNEFLWFEFVRHVLAEVCTSVLGFRRSGTQGFRCSGIQASDSWRVDSGGRSGKDWSSPPPGEMVTKIVMESKRRMTSWTPNKTKLRTLLYIYIYKLTYCSIIYVTFSIVIHVHNYLH